MAQQSTQQITRLRRGARRKRKHQKAPSLVLPLIGIAAAMLFLVWVVVSFQALTTDHSASVSAADKHNLPEVLRSPTSLDNNVKRTRDGVAQTIKPYQSPLLIFTCSRANYLTETLDNIYQHIPTTCKMGCPIVISQDRDQPDVTQTIESFKVKFEAKGIPFFHIVHPNTPGLRGNPYQKLAVHYGWALRTLFDGKAYDKFSLPDRVIILEEDLRIAPDFFGYFEATAPLLDKDPNLLAVSAFNDNGYENQVTDPKRLLRSDFFPGLGWMMTRNTWVNDIGSKWPSGYWDDWLREPPQRQNRQFIRPEITRTFHFGEKGGASQNQFGGSHNRIMLNSDPVEWASQDLSYLEADNFARNYASMVANAQLVGSQREAIEIAKGGHNARVEYSSIAGFAGMARQFNLMTDEKAKIFRTAYKGVVETRAFGQNFVFLTPSLNELKASFGNAWPSQSIE